MNCNHYCFLLLFFIEILCPSVFAQTKENLKEINPNANIDFTLNKKRKYTYFASDRTSENGKYDVYKITPTEQEPTLILIRGHLDMPPNQRKAKITVTNASNDEKIGIYNTNANTGNYLMILVPNVKYLFKVEELGFDLFEQEVDVPLRIDYEVCKQEIKIKKNEQGKSVLMINNFFSDENEKVFIMKATIDSLQGANYLANITEEIKASKDGKAFSNVDELVKKQLEEEKKKPAEALKAFQKNDFEKALVLYSQLAKNDPTDAMINYYYGICLFNTNKSKAKAINALELAAHSKKAPYDVYYYLGKVYHLSYMFKDGLRSLEEYKKFAKPEELVKNGVLELISNCQHGNSLMSEQLNMEVIKRTNVDETNMLASYNPDLVTDWLMYKTDFFISPLDKKKEEKLLMCKAGSREIIQVSYGIKEQNGKDFYKNSIAVNGMKGQSLPLSNEINTPYDEDYPYITKDGKTLYFSSKGHNSMGGYDIFKSTRIDSASAWSKPVNMGYPINSTYDDIMFVPDTANELGFYCSNRKNGRYEFIEIKTPQKWNEYSVIKGNFTTIDSTEVRDALITVYNSNNEEIAGVYKTNSETGNYLMVLMPGITYNMELECDGFPLLKKTFEVPIKKGDFILRQELRLRKDGSFNIFKVNNYFTEVDASKVSAENLPQREKKTEAPKVEVQKTHETKKEYVSNKSKRTPEQEEKDNLQLKQAKGLYEQQHYKEAINIFQHLEKDIDLTPLDAYYCGLSLYNFNKDKTVCLTYLETAATSKSTPMEVFYYLGKANHFCYRFSRAIKAYETFITLAKPADVKKLNIEKEIEANKNGQMLVNNSPYMVEVFEKKYIAKESVHIAFTQIESGAKILVATDDIISAVDKKKGFLPSIFLSADKSTILFSSYGDNEVNGKDIYKLIHTPDGKWSVTPQNISVINSAMDEEFPSLSNDGKTLYFSSKAFNSMGGYDIFKSTLNEETQEWSAPVNMGAPINSPMDDVYYLE